MGLDAPWREFRSVRHLASIVLLQLGVEIARDADVEAFRVVEVFENVDVALQHLSPLARQQSYIHSNISYFRQTITAIHTPGFDFQVRLFGTSIRPEKEASSAENQAHQNHCGRHAAREPRLRNP